MLKICPLLIQNANLIGLLTFHQATPPLLVLCSSLVLHIVSSLPAPGRKLPKDRGLGFGHFYTPDVQFRQAQSALRV